MNVKQMVKERSEKNGFNEFNNKWFMRGYRKGYTEGYIEAQNNFLNLLKAAKENRSSPTPIIVYGPITFLGPKPSTERENKTT